MGGSSSSQVTGYKYFANFLLFIGNPIEKLLNINFDKRGWIANERISYGSNGEMIYIEKPNLYGENEGGVYGTLRVKHGTNNQTACVQYKKYMETQGLPVSAYPYQSYILFDGGGFPDGAYGLTEEELESTGDELEENSSWYGGGFYLGNSGYMKEMLLWPKRIHVKNDGSPQWYDAKAEIPDVELIVSNILSGDVPNFIYELNHGGFEFTYNPVYGIYGNGGSSAYGGVENPTISESIYFSPSSEELNVLDLIEINATISGNFKTFEIELIGDSTVYKYDVQKTGGENEAKSVYINIVCKVNTIFPYIYATATGTIGGATTSLYSWNFTSSTRAIDSFEYANAIKALDINPIHKIREILTDDTAMNKPESDVNNSNFIKAADRIYDERLGISWAITEKSCIDAINELCSHIEAGVRINRQTGLYEMVLFRDDWFEESEIHSLAENKIKSMQIDPINVEDVKNYLNVSHYDRENIKDASFSIAENASIKNAGGFANAEAADFPYFMNQRNAAVVAQWKLKQFTTPCWKGTFTTGYNEARKWNRYDIVKINWSRKNIVDLPVRIMSINLGDGINNTVSIDFVEVVPFSDELTSTVAIDDKIDTTPLPPQPAVFKAFELPYLEAVQAQGQRSVDDELAHNPNIGYVAVVAQRPQNNSLNAQMHTDAGSGYENSAVIQYCETAKLDQAIDRMSSSFIVKNVGDIDSVRVGSQIFINDETMVYQSFDVVTKLLTVKRGALDTVPQTHAADSILFFADDFVAADQDQYMDGEIIDVKAITTTPSGVLSLDDVDAQAVEIQSRAIRPYPPANVQINGEYWAAEYESSISISWVHRNRIQQTGGAIIGFYEASVTIESDTTYLLKVFEIDSNSIESEFFNQNIGLVDTYSIDLSTLLTTTTSVRLELKSIRNGFESFQAVKHTMFASFNPPSNLTAAYIDGAIQLDWEFEE